MRILIVNDFFSQGGAEVQAHDLFKMYIEMGYDVAMITFDPKYNNGLIENNKYNYKRSNTIFGKFLNKFFVNLKAKKFVNKILLDFNPDLVHIHNNLKMTKTLCQCITKYRIIQTFHDFGFICPKGTCVKDNGEECLGYFTEECKSCKGLVRNHIKSAEIKRNKDWINSNVDLKFCPSQYLANKLNLNGFNNCKVFPNLINIATEKNFIFANKRDYLYCGVISREKGIVNLVEAFKQLDTDGYNFQLTVVGSVSDNFLREFDLLIKGCRNIKFLGKKSHDEVMSLYKSSLCLIVPSLWLENYPNVMLEAISMNTLCIGSNRGGIVEILCEDKDLLFSPLSISELKNKIIAVNDLTEEDYGFKVKKIKDRIERINGYNNVSSKFREEVEKFANLN